MPTFNKHYIDKQTGSHGPEGLANMGAILQVEVNLPQPLINWLGQQNQPIPAPISGMALIDTGASRTCVDKSVLANLQINPIGVVSVGTAGGLVQCPLFPARLGFPEPKLTVDLSSVISVDLQAQNIQGIPLIALVGRDILRFCNFIYNGSGGFFTLSF